MFNLAFYTCGLLRGGFGSKQVSGFFELAPSVFEAANSAAGCIAHMMDQERGWPPAAQDWGPWGRYAVPRFFNDLPADLSERVSATLSVWVDVHAVRRFAYGGSHGTALKRRADWFEKTDHTQYVMWWIDEWTWPTWVVGAQKLEARQDNGPSPDAFNFATIFPAP